MAVLPALPASAMVSAVLLLGAASRLALLVMMSPAPLAPHHTRAHVASASASAEGGDLT